MACITPFNVKMKDSTLRVQVPCGVCPDCRARRASAWSFRLMQEDKTATSSTFLTITYDTRHVHFTKSGFMDLNKKDLQNFFKRLRYYHGEQGNKIKYYAVGEYGGRTKRPHYHAIIFNGNVELMQNAWPFGQLHYGDVSGASVGYTLKYITKPKTVPLHRNDDRTPEFSLMSKGLGKNTLHQTWFNGIRPPLMIVCTSILKVVKKCLCRAIIRIRYIIRKSADILKVFGRKSISS